MKKLLLVLVAVSAAAMTSAPGWAADAPIIGSWRMTSLEVPAASGARQAIPYSGMIIFTEGGTMSVQAMNPDAAAPDSPYTLRGYEAYYGPVTINAAEGAFEITIESAAVRGLIGQKFKRAFQVSGDQLVLTPTSPDEH